MKKFYDRQWRKILENGIDEKSIDDVLFSRLTALSYSQSQDAKMREKAIAYLERSSLLNFSISQDQLFNIDNYQIPEICAKRLGADLNAVVYRLKAGEGEKSTANNDIHEIAFFEKSQDGRFLFSHKLDLKSLHQEHCKHALSGCQIRQIGDLTLHQAAKMVTKFTGDARLVLEAQLAILQHNLYATGGVGIAANQCADIEAPLQIVLSGVNYENPEHVVKAITRYPTALFPKMKVLINPVILNLSTEMSEFSEGCLSVEGSIRGVVKRAKSVEVRYQDIEGKEHEEVFTGTDARVMLHELDHILNGYVYMQRLIEELTREQCRDLLDIINAVMGREREVKQANLFASPTTVFERSKDGILSFNAKMANELLMAMSSDTLIGISSKLQSVLNAHRLSRA